MEQFDDTNAVDRAFDDGGQRARSLEVTRAARARTHAGGPLPSASIVIPVKNERRFLREQLQALAQQSYRGEWEVIVVDNGSDDGSAAVARSFQGRLPLTVVSAIDKQGGAHARNVGAKRARGEILIFCDADDVVAKDWLYHMGRALQRHDFVAGALELERLNKQAPWRRPAFTGSGEIALLYRPFAIGCNIGVTRRAFEACGGFDESMRWGEDVDFSWRLQLKGYELADAPNAVIHYRYRDDQSRAARQTVQYAKAHVHLYKKFARHGMPRWPMSWVLSEYRWLLRNADCWLKSGEGHRRQEWLQRAAERTGRLLGSIRFRALYL